jgi:hypothetical protein
MQCDPEEFKLIMEIAVSSGYFRGVGVTKAAEQLKDPSSSSEGRTFLEVLQACPISNSLSSARDLALPFSLHPAPSPPQLEAAQTPARAIEQFPETVIQERRAIEQAASPKRSFPLVRLLFYYLGLSCLGGLLFLSVRSGNLVGIGAIENSLNGLNPSNASPSPSALPTPVSLPKPTPSTSVSQRVQQLLTQPAAP